MKSKKPILDLTRGNIKWPLSVKVRRVLWSLCWYVFFRPTPKRAGNGWRLFLLKVFGAKIHGNALVLPGCRILQPWQLEIGNGSAIGDQVEIYNYALVSIGSMTVVSQYTYLCTGTHDYTHPHMPLTWEPITIKDFCWVAADVFVGPGVTIGEGAVVGARSTVTKDVPAWMVCGGNPCQPIKPRVVRRLEEA